MNTKIGATILALSMATMALFGVAAATYTPGTGPGQFPPGGAPNSVGCQEFGPCANGVAGSTCDGDAFSVLPTDCPAGAPGPSLNENYCTDHTQALGYGGTVTGTKNDYHRYANDNAIGLLDFCNQLLGPVGWAQCVEGVQVGDVLTAAPGVVPAVVALTTTDTGPAFLVANQATDGLLNGAGLYQNQCAGIAGTGTDGEFEYGSAEAALNVVLGSAGARTEPAFATGAADSSGHAGVATVGGGADVCLGPAASAHHGSDKTIYVADSVWGGNVGFSVYADWSAPSYLSTDSEDDNAVATTGVSHCGDGVLDPCNTAAGAPASGQQSLQQKVEGLTVTPGDVTNVLLPAPLSSAQLAANLATTRACNPLDYGQHVSSTGAVNVIDGETTAGAGGAPNGSTANSWTAPSGDTLAQWGNGGAEGYLFVVLDQPGATVCYDVGGACGGVPGGDAGVTAHTDSVPTAGWVWTG